MLTDTPRIFLNSQNIEMCVSDCHKLLVNILKASFKKLFTGYIMNVIAEIRNGKKLPQNKSVTELICKNNSTNDNFNFINEKFKKVIQNEEILNKLKI